MIFTSKNVFFSNRIIKHVKASISYYRSSFVAKDSIRTCICGIKYHPPSLSNGEIKRNHLLRRQGIKTFSNYSAQSFNDEHTRVGVMGQTERDYRNAVLMEIKESLKNELSDLDVIELLEIATFANVKQQDLEFLNCYINVLQKLDKNNFFYDKYFQHYCHLTNGSLETVNTHSGSEQLKKKFELINKRKSQKYFKSEDNVLKNSVFGVSNEIENHFQLKDKADMKKNQQPSKSILKAVERSPTDYINIVINKLEYALDCDSISKEDIIGILKKACGCAVFKDNINSKFFDAFYKVIHKLKDLDESNFNEFRKYFFRMIVATLNCHDFSASYFIPFVTTYTEYVKLGKDDLHAIIYYILMEKIMRNEGPDLTVGDRFWLLKAMIEVDCLRYGYLEYLQNSVMKNLKNQTHDSNNSAVTIDHKFLYLQASAIKRHSDLDFVEHVRELVIENPGLLEKSVENLYVFLENLALTDFQNQRKNYWPHLRRFIAELPVLQDVNKWEETKIFHHVNVVKLLLLWGICPKPLLTSLSERCNANKEEEILNLPKRDFFYVCDVLISINQAVHALHPSFNKPFLNANTFSEVKNKLKLTESFDAVRRFTSSFKNHLTQEINKNDCVLSNCFTKQGVRIDAALALNEANEVFSFPENITNNDENYLEDISIPDDYQWVLLFILRSRQKDVARNDHKMIDSRIQLNMKSLQAMGYLTIPIMRDSFKDEGAKKIISKTWKLIKEKNDSSLLVSEVGKIVEPALFE